MTALHSGLLLTRLAMRKPSLARVIKTGGVPVKMSLIRVNWPWLSEQEISARPWALYSKPEKEHKTQGKKTKDKKPLFTNHWNAFGS